MGVYPADAEFKRILGKARCRLESRAVTVTAPDGATLNARGNCVRPLNVRRALRRSVRTGFVSWQRRIGHRDEHRLIRTNHCYQSCTKVVIDRPSAAC